MFPLIGLLPGLAWLAYFLWRDRYQDWSFANVAKVFLAGFISTIPGIALESLIGASIQQASIFRAADASFLRIAPIEECLKLLAVWLITYRGIDFREPLDGIVYSTSSALGFACAENVIHLLRMGPGIIPDRILFATPAHIMFSAMWGYSMGIARFQRDAEVTTILKGLLLAVCLHGGYNFLVAIQPGVARATLIPLMVLMAWLMIRRVRRFRRSFPYPPLGKGALICCPHCGAYTLEHEPVCARCGGLVPPMEHDAPRFCATCRARLDPRADTCSRCGERVSITEPCPRANSSGTAWSKRLSAADDSAVEKSPLAVKNQ